MKDLKYGLDIQHFAEGDGEGTSAQTSQNQSEKAPEIDYSKIEEIINKRSNSTADSVLKGYLKEQGLTGDELNEAVKSYKTQKEQARLNAENESKSIREENERLKKEILDSQIESKVKSIAAEKKVKGEHMAYVLRLIDRKDFVKKDGSLDEEKIEASIDTVLKDFPAFTAKDESTGFQQIGSGGSSKSGEDADKALRKAFGLK